MWNDIEKPKSMPVMTNCDTEVTEAEEWGYTVLYSSLDNPVLLWEFNYKITLNLSSCSLSREWICKIIWYIKTGNNNKSITMGRLHVNVDRFCNE